MTIFLRAESWLKKPGNINLQSAIKASKVIFDNESTSAVPKALRSGTGGLFIIS
jgi:hypothetical protein